MFGGQSRTVRCGAARAARPNKGRQARHVIERHGGRRIPHRHWGQRQRERTSTNNYQIIDGSWNRPVGLVECPE
jgi:hypothetical protein